MTWDGCWWLCVMCEDDGQWWCRCVGMVCRLWCVTCGDRCGGVPVVCADAWGRRTGGG